MLIFFMLKSKNITVESSLVCQYRSVRAEDISNETFFLYLLNNVLSTLNVGLYYKKEKKKLQDPVHDRRQCNMCLCIHVGSGPAWAVSA